jgi:hypothetical protein
MNMLLVLIGIIWGVAVSEIGGHFRWPTWVQIAVLFAGVAALSGVLWYSGFSL